MQKRKRRVPKDRVREQRTEIAIRLTMMDDISDQNQVILEDIPVIQLQHVPAEYAERARLVQVLSTYAAAEATGNRDAPLISLTVSPEGMMHIHLRAIWPRKLSGFFLIEHDKPELPPQHILEDLWFFGVGSETDLVAACKEVPYYWKGTAWKNLQVLPMVEFFRFINTFAGNMYDIPRRGERCEIELGLWGDSRWVDIFEELDHIDAENMGVTGFDGPG